MSYEIATPILKTSAQALLNVITGVQANNMEIAQAKAITTAASKIPQHVSMDLKVRMSAPRLAEIEQQTAA